MMLSFCLFYHYSCNFLSRVSESEFAYLGFETLYLVFVSDKRNGIIDEPCPCVGIGTEYCSVVVRQCACVFCLMVFRHIRRGDEDARLRQETKFRDA